MIIICEPQCIGFEHAEFNAALLSVIKNTFPDEKIMFLAEKEHISNVQNLLKKHYSDFCDYHVIEVPERYDRESKRFLTEFRLTKKVFSLAKKMKCEKVIFSSITSPTLVSIKFWLTFFRNTESIVIPHSILETITKYPHISRDFIFWIKIWISYFNSDRLRYVVLGKPLENELLTEIPKIRKNVYSLNHPFFYRNNQIKPLSDKIKFGFLGVGIIKKGIEDFFNLAEHIKNKNSGIKSEFILIGQLLDKIKFSEDSVSTTSSNQPLSREEYDELAKSIDYALFFYDKNQYKLIASGAFFDAIANLKPIIAIKNPFFEYYFNLMGDIGYLCNNTEEMKDIISNIVENPPKEHFITQQENMLKGREKLSFKNLAEEFKRACK